MLMARGHPLVKSRRALEGMRDEHNSLALNMSSLGGGGRDVIGVVTVGRVTGVRVAGGSRMTAAPVAIMGVAAHSGWAAAVVVGAASSAPAVLARSRIELIDEHVPESKQPYHAVETLDIKEAERRLERYQAQAERMAVSSLTRIRDEVAQRGYRLRSMGLLDSSGRKGGSLQSILASHALIHTADGEHFRSALVAAAERLGLNVSRVPIRDVEAQAQAALGLAPTRLQDAVADLGRPLGAPWGADQKKAALLAWLLLRRNRI